MVAREKLLFRIRAIIIFFIVALIVSGLTAFPVYTELKWIIGKNFFSAETTLGKWLHTVWLGVNETEQKHRRMGDALLHSYFSAGPDCRIASGHCLVSYSN